MTLREQAEAASRVVIEKDHVYQEVGQIVALDVERTEIDPQTIIALLDVVEAARAVLRAQGTAEGEDYSLDRETEALIGLHHALDALPGDVL